MHGSIHGWPLPARTFSLLPPATAATTPSGLVGLTFEPPFSACPSSLLCPTYRNVPLMIFSWGGFWNWDCALSESGTTFCFSRAGNKHRAQRRGHRATDAWIKNFPVALPQLRNLAETDGKPCEHRNEPIGGCVYAHPDEHALLSRRVVLTFVLESWSVVDVS